MKVSALTFSLLATIVSGIAVPEVAPRQSQTFRPTLAVNIKQDSPNTAFGATTTGVVSRTGGQHDIQTLLSYTLNSSVSGKKCSLSFSGPATVSGSKTVQIFDVGGPITTSNTFLSRPYRNNFRCTMTINPTGPATISTDISCGSFDCPTGVVGFEVVPENDTVGVTWDTTSAGLIITSA